MKDKVAIITPCFNREHTLQETANSVLGQTHANWEWIVVDDGSSDKSWELIQTLCDQDERIKLRACELEVERVQHKDAYCWIFPLPCMP